MSILLAYVPRWSRRTGTAALVCLSAIGCATGSEKAQSGEPGAGNEAVEEPRPERSERIDYEQQLGSLEDAIRAIGYGRDIGLVATKGLEDRELAAFSLKNASAEDTAQAIAAKTGLKVAPQDGYYFFYAPGYEQLLDVSLEGKLPPRYGEVRGQFAFAADMKLHTVFYWISQSLEIALVADNIVADTPIGPMTLPESTLEEGLGALVKSAMLVQYEIESTDEYILLRAPQNVHPPSLLLNAGALSTQQEAALDRKVSVYLPSTPPDPARIELPPGPQPIGTVLDDLSDQLGMPVRVETGLDELPVNPAVLSKVRVRTALDLLIRQWPKPVFGYEVTETGILIRVRGPQELPAAPTAEEVSSPAPEAESTPPLTIAELEQEAPEELARIDAPEGPIEAVTPETPEEVAEIAVPETAPEEPAEAPFEASSPEAAPEALDDAASEVSGMRSSWVDERADSPAFESFRPGEFAFIPDGEFDMGSEVDPGETAKLFGGEAAWFADEVPRRRVTLTRSFWMGRTEVTNAAFLEFVDATGYKTEAEVRGWGLAFDAEAKTWQRVNGANWRNPGWDPAPDLPLVLVTWNDAQAYVEWLNKQDGGVYRLPTEAEWEYACRAGAATRYHWGDRPEDGAGWLNAADQHSSPHGGAWEHPFPFDDGHWSAAPVASYQPNVWGLHDMHGNVWEWCQDLYGPYEGETISGPQGPAAGTYRVLRGGSWFSDPSGCRAAARAHGSPTFSSDNLGFRLVREIDRRP